MIRLKAAVASAALTLSLIGASSSAFAIDSIDKLLLQINGASTYGATPEVVVQVPYGQQTAEAPVPLDANVGARPSETTVLDMTGADGTLRACYAHGGMASQSTNLNYYCKYESLSVGATANSGSNYILPPDAPTNYFGSADAGDDHIADCVGRGGTLIQLTNSNWACAM